MRSTILGQSCSTGFSLTHIRPYISESLDCQSTRGGKNPLGIRFWSLYETSWWVSSQHCSKSRLKIQATRATVNGGLQFSSHCGKLLTLPAHLSAEERLLERLGRSRRYS